MSCQKWIRDVDDTTIKICGEAPSIEGYSLCKKCFMFSRCPIIRDFGFSARDNPHMCFLNNVPLALIRSDARHEDLVNETRARDYTYEYFLVGGYEHDILREANNEERKLAERYHIKIALHA